MNTRPTAEIPVERLTKRSGAAYRAPRSRVAIRVERVLNAALAGEPHVVLNVSPAELLAEPGPVAEVISAALERAGPGLTGQWRVTEPFRRSGVSDEIFNALAAKNPITRAAAANLCGALRLTESVPWIGDLIHDPIPQVRDAAIRALGRMGGRRAVETLMAATGTITLHRLAITLAEAASDIDIEALMRQPANERVAVVTVLACGLRRDNLRASPLLGIAHDRRWPKQVRLAACRSLGMIADISVAEGISLLAEKDPDQDIRQAAQRARRRMRRAAVGRAE